MSARRAVAISLLASSAWGASGLEVKAPAQVVARRSLEGRVAFPAGPFTMGIDEAGQRAAIAMCREELGAANGGRGSTAPHEQRACRPELFVLELPARRVLLSAFELDRTEVTAAAYRACVAEGACAADPLLQPDRRFAGDALPITSVTWPEADTYCRARGARLPTEAEWERAARGSRGRTWPWGNEPRPEAFNHGRTRLVNELGPTPFFLLEPDPLDGHAFLAPVGSYPAGATPEGVLDLAGNALEWTADAFQEGGALVNPRAAAGGMRVVRGGSFRQPRYQARGSTRDALPPETRSPEIGFRCARPLGRAD